MKQYRIEPEQEIISKTGIEFFYSTRSVKKRSVRPHIHSAIELLFIDMGKLQIYADDKETHVKRGDVVLFRSNTIHQVFAEEDGEAGYHVFKFSPALIMDLATPEHRESYLLQLALNAKNEKWVWSAEESEKNGLHAALQILIDANEDAEVGSDLSMKIGAASVLRALLRDLLPKEHDTQALLGNDALRHIYDVTVHINAHYAENLTATDCASLAFMSYSYFSRCFLRVTGKSFKEYLNITRVNHAEKELLSTEKSVTEIAADCGFNNVSYFITVYKKIKGVTPYSLRTRSKT